MRAVLISIFLVISLSTYAQFGIKGFKYFVSEDTSPQLGNTISGELILAFPLTENYLLEARGGVIYINHKIQFKTIPNYSTEYTPDNFVVYPGTLTQTRFAEYELAIGVNLNFLNFDKYKAYIGADVIAGGYDTEYEFNSKGSSGSEMASNPILGFRIRLGTSYMLNDWLEPFVEAGYYRKRYYGIADLSAMDFGIGFKFWINGKD